jgi:hypothetical protein
MRGEMFAARSFSAHVCAADVRGETVRGTDFSAHVWLFQQQSFLGSKLRRNNAAPLS